MKIHALALLAALAAAPLSALAQQGPPPSGMGGPGMGGPGMMGGPSMQQMQQMHQMHEQARTKILAALTPAHKSLLAKVVGDLAIADKPDQAAAAAQLDAALTPAEKTTITSVHTDMMKQMQSMMGGQGGQMGQRMGHGKNMNDPGAILLMLSHPMPMGGPPPH